MGSDRNVEGIVQPKPEEKGALKDRGRRCWYKIWTSQVARLPRVLSPGQFWPHVGGASGGAKYGSYTWHGKPWGRCKGHYIQHCASPFRLQISTSTLKQRSFKVIDGLEESDASVNLIFQGNYKESEWA